MDFRFYVIISLYKNEDIDLNKLITTEDPPANVYYHVGQIIAVLA